MFEYKVVPAPTRAVKVRGLKTTSDRFAHLLTEALNALAGDGWEYLRTETLPCDERRGLTGTRTTTQVVMIFRRQIAAYAPPTEPAMSKAEPHAEARQELRPEMRHEQRPAPATDPRRAEPVFRPGALMRPEGERAFPPLRGAPSGDDGDGQR